MNSFVDRYFPVLDNGFVALKDSMGSDIDIEEAARVSYGKGTRKQSETRQLLRYLMRHKHTTPFEMVVLKFHISMPVHVHRQFIRHRMSTTNEYSARYSVVPEVTYEDYSLNIQSKNNKQGRSDEISQKDKDYANKIKELRKHSFDLYNDMVEDGVAREQARMHLPLNTYTYFYWKIDLHNLFHFLKLRCDSHAQWEIRQYANVLAGLAQTVAPLAFEAWYDYNYMAVNFTRLDILVLNFLMKKGIAIADIIEPSHKNTHFQQEIKEYALEIGMGDREVTEFLTKTHVYENKKFDLDIANSFDYTKFEVK